MFMLGTFHYPNPTFMVSNALLFFVMTFTYVVMGKLSFIFFLAENLLEEDEMIS